MDVGTVVVVDPAVVAVIELELVLGSPEVMAVDVVVDETPLLPHALIASPSAIVKANIRFCIRNLHLHDSQVFVAQTTCIALFRRLQEAVD